MLEAAYCLPCPESFRSRRDELVSTSAGRGQETSSRDESDARLTRLVSSAKHHPPLHPRRLPSPSTLPPSSALNASRQRTLRSHERCWQRAMASQPPTRASISDRRAASQRQQRSRPASALLPSPLDESRSGADSKNAVHHRKTSTTTETKRTTEARHTIIRRTISPIKRDSGPARKSSEAERPVSKFSVRKQSDEAGM